MGNSDGEIPRQRVRARAASTDRTIHKADAQGSGGVSGGRLGGNAYVDGRTEGGRREERAVIKEKCMKAAGGGEGRVG